MRDKFRYVMLFSLSLYVILILIYLVRIFSIGKHSVIHQPNIMPFINLLHYEDKKAAVRNIVFNAIVFVPLGIYLSKLIKSRHKYIIALIIPILIEIMQLAFQTGVFDIDDIIINTLSCEITLYLFDHFKERKVTIIIVKVFAIISIVAYALILSRILL